MTQEARPLSRSTFDKSRFAPYLNLAQNNLKIIFEEIHTKLDMERKDYKLQAAPLLKALKEQEKDPALQKRILILLQKYLPWTTLLLFEINLSVKQEQVSKELIYFLADVEFKQSITHLIKLLNSTNHRDIKKNTDLKQVVIKLTKLLKIDIEQKSWNTQEKRSLKELNTSLKNYKNLDEKKFEELKKALEEYESLRETKKLDLIKQMVNLIKSSSKSRTAEGKQIIQSLQPYTESNKISEHKRIEITNKLDEYISQIKLETTVEEEFTTQFIDIIKRLNTERNFNTHFYHKATQPKSFDFQPIWKAAKERAIENEKRRGDENDKSIKETVKMIEKATVTFNTPQHQFTDDGLLYFTCLFLERSEALYFINLFDQYKVKNKPKEDQASRATILSLIAYCAKLPQPKLQSGQLHLDMLGELMRVPDEIYRNLTEQQQKAFVTFDDLTFNEGLERIVQQRTTMKRHDDRFPYFALRWLEQIDAFDSLRFHIHLAKWLEESYSKVINGEEQTRNIFHPLRTFGKLLDFPDELTSWEHKGTTIPTEDIYQYAPHYQITGNRIGFRFTTNEHQKQLQNKQPLQPDAILSTYELPNLCWYQLLYQAYLKKQSNDSSLPALPSPEQFILNYLTELHRFYEDVAQNKVPRFDTDKHKEESVRLNQKMDKSARKEAIENRAAIYQEVLSANYDLDVYDFPDDLKAYLLKTNQTGSIKSRVVKKLKKKIQETKGLLKSMDRYDELIKAEPDLLRQPLTVQLQKARLPKVGELATWLARDWTFYKPAAEKGRDKPNNQQYNTLQSMLALYNPYKRKMLQNYLDEIFGTTDKALTFPFLKDLKEELHKCDYITNIYQSYLRLKVTWLKKKLQAVEQTKNNKVIKKEVDSFMDAKTLSDSNSSSTFIKEKVLRYKNTATLLPRGLFNNPIKQLIDLLTDIDTKGRANNVYLLEQYLHTLAPAFYDYERIYERGEEKNRETVLITNSDIPAQLLQKRKDLRVEIVKTEARFEDEKDKLADEEIATLQIQRSRSRFIKKIAAVEKDIRYRKHTDRLLWLMIKQLAENNNDIQNMYQLENENLVNIGFDKQQFLENKPILSVELHGRKVTAQLHLRQYGRFRRFMKDHRLKNLFAYFPTDEDIILQVLQEELKRYDMERPKLMEKILVFEEILWAKHEAALIAFQQSQWKKPEAVKYVNHGVQLQFVEQKYGNIADFELMRKIRNTFNHNDVFVLPEMERKALMAERKDHVPPNEQEQHKIQPFIAGRITELAILEYEKMIRQIR